MTIVAPSIGVGRFACITANGGSTGDAITVSARIVLRRNKGAAVQVFLAVESTIE